MRKIHPATFYIFTPVYAMPLYIAMMIILFILTPPDSYLRGVFFDRGPAPFLILLVFINTIILATLAMIRHDHRTTTVISIFSMNFWALVIGMIGNIIGLGSMISGAAQACNQSNTPDWTEIINSCTIGIGVSSDPFLLALCCIALTTPFIVILCSTQKTKS